MENPRSLREVNSRDGIISKKDRRHWYAFIVRIILFSSEPDPNALSQQYLISR
jgi:hypothetical protein